MKLFLWIISLLFSFGLYAQYEIGMMPADAFPEFDVYTKFNGDKILSVRFQNYEHRLYGLRLSLEQDPYSDYLSFDLHDGRYLDRHGYEGETFEIAKTSKPVESFWVRENQEINISQVFRRYYQAEKLKTMDGFLFSPSDIEKVVIKTSAKKKSVININRPHDNWLERVRFSNENDINLIARKIYRKIKYNNYDFMQLTGYINKLLPEIIFSQEDIYQILQVDNVLNLENALKKINVSCNVLFNR